MIEEEIVKESRFATIARRGLMLPAETREQIRATGIRCRPQLEIVFQQQSKVWMLRGEESGGAVELLGHYVGFVGNRGNTLTWLQRVQNFIPNGTHAIVVTSELVRVEVFRYEKTYDLLITKHWLEGDGNRRPDLRSTILFHGRNGSLETELWGKDSPFRGAAIPHFYQRSGEPGGPDSMWAESVMKATEGVCCPGCRHSHLLAAFVDREREELSEVMA
jgi:hypothetical protein